jgi:hypothetical protein
VIFDANDHAALATLFALRSDGTPVYAGYKPHVAEAPNGDGRVDARKRYLHVAQKYAPPQWALDILSRAHWEACRVAEAIGVPAEFYPRVENSTLRVLDYPAGAGTEEHTDFDLFTLNLWRSTPNDHEAWEHHTDTVAHTGAEWNEWTPGADAYHMGELGELVGLGPAVKHRVPARPYAQRALVYFAMPANAAELPQPVERFLHDGPLTVADWLKERLSRSRVYK